MPTISHRELRNNSAEILRRVADGERFDVTNHGVVIAELGPKEHLTELDRLRALGRVRAATAPRAAVWEIEPMESDWSCAAIIDDLRGDR